MDVKKSKAILLERRTLQIRTSFAKLKEQSPSRFLARAFIFGLFLISFFAVSPLHAQSFEACFSTGQWQPQTLAKQTASSLFAGGANTTPFFQIILCEPLRTGFFLGQSLGFWHQKKVSSADVKKLSLFPVDFILKHRLVVDSALMPYVSYGGGVVLALRTSRNASIGLPPQVGLDIFVETGIDARLGRALGLHLSFAYHYTKFQVPVGETDDFTGPQGMVGIFWKF